MWVATAQFSACCRDVAAEDAPPCTPESAGLAADDVIEPPVLAPPERCDFRVVAESYFGASIIVIDDEDELQYYLECDVVTRPPSGVDFANQRAVLLTADNVTSVPWIVRDAEGVHFAALTGCNDGSVYSHRLFYVVDADERVELFACERGVCAHNTCDVPRPAPA